MLVSVVLVFLATVMAILLGSRGIPEVIAVTNAVSRVGCVEDHFCLTGLHRVLVPGRASAIVQVTIPFDRFHVMIILDDGCL